MRSHDESRTHADAACMAAGHGYLAIPRRVEIVVVATLVAVSLAAWYVTVADARTMRGMAMGLGHVGTRVVGPMGSAAFLAMWVAMMTAMMLPAVAPMVLAHLAVARRRGDGFGPTLLFIGGYGAVWAAIGLVPLAAFVAFTRLADDATPSRWLSLLAGAILVLAGAYQFSGWKRRCLDHCRSPFAFVAHHDFGGGMASALRAGIVHGAYCLGCCWALMLVLLVVGLMNLAWMAALFVLIYAEKTWRHGTMLARIAGTALVILGVAIATEPSLLALVSD